MFKHVSKIKLGMGRDGFLPRRDGTRHLSRDEKNIETENETRQTHVKTIRDFLLFQISQSRLISRQTCQYRDKTRLP